MINVLIACECSQTELAAFRSAGFNAFSCDIQECYGDFPDFHYCGDVMDILYAPVTFKVQSGKYFYVERWDLLIAHPPCTYLSRAGACRLNNKNTGFNTERFNLGCSAADFFLQLYNAPVPHICIENPIPLAIYNLPKPSQYIDPFQFGDPWNKHTGLWLKNLPLLVPTTVVSSRGSWVMSTRSQRLRSQGFPGIASAYVSQFGNYVRSLNYVK